MNAHQLPFQNRWTNGEHAWQWHCELERLGVPTVRAMFIDHEVHQVRKHAVIYDVPPEFVRDWLAFHDLHETRRARLWLFASVALAVIALLVAIAALMRP